MFILYKHTDDRVLMIFRRFSTTKLLRRSGEDFRTFSDNSSRRMPRHIRDLNVESARDFKFNQAAQWSSNEENDQKMTDNAYLFRVYVLHTCVS